MRVSFDYDCTLSEPHVQVIAKSMVYAGHDVWIVTARCDDRPYLKGAALINSLNRDLFTVAERVGIPTDKIVMTEGEFKHKTIVKLDIELHFDDVAEEVHLIHLAGRNALLMWDSECISYIRHDQFGAGLF